MRDIIRSAAIVKIRMALVDVLPKQMARQAAAHAKYMQKPWQA